MSSNNQTPISSASVFVNGKHLFYEVYGKGTPLFLLHGYSLSSLSWKPYIADFDDTYAVYLIDLTGHGKSEPFRESLSIQSVAQDILALTEHLGLDSIRAIGFSFGGDVLYQLALLRPQLIASMITIGAVGTWDVRDFPTYLESYIYENRDNFPWLKTSHQSEEHIRGIMDQFKNYTVHLSNEELSLIRAEVMVVMGDDDEGIEFEEIARVKRYIKQSDIWVLPNVSHGAHEGENKNEFVAKAKEFFAKRN